MCCILQGFERLLDDLSVPHFSGGFELPGQPEKFFKYFHGRPLLTTLVVPSGT